MSSEPTFLVVTPNPAIDRRIHVAQLAVSEVNRATEVMSGAGGKGLNVVRAARTLDCHAVATAPLGGTPVNCLPIWALPRDWTLIGTGWKRAIRVSAP